MQESYQKNDHNDEENEDDPPNLRIGDRYMRSQPQITNGGA